MSSTIAISVFFGIIVLALMLTSLCLRAKPHQPVSTIKDDETVVFFKTDAWLDEAAQEWVVPIHAWIYEPEKSNLRISAFRRLLKAKYGFIPSSEEEANFIRRTSLLIADNERGKTLAIKLGSGVVISPKSISNGHVKTTVRVPVKDAVGQSVISYQAILKKRDKRKFYGESFLRPSVGVSVISDIDDTVKITDVTNRVQLIENTFYKNFAAVEGMVSLYSKWYSGGASFHFVSSSPWYLYAPLVEFLEESSFPPATLSLKAFRFRDKSLFELFKKGTETKPPAIRAILNMYPKRKFILVGDSGEQDAEVYLKIAQEYPWQIKKILIRNIGGSVDTHEQLRKVFSPLSENQWQAFNNPTEIHGVFDKP